MKNVFITGASGTGKSTVIEHILQKYPESFLKIACTTRKPREGEEDGKQYYFITEEDFQAKIKSGYFLEYVEFNGKHYGTPRDITISAEQTCNDSKTLDSSTGTLITPFPTKSIQIFDVEIKGIQFFSDLIERDESILGPRSNNIFVCLHASRDVVKSRLSNRKGMTKEDLDSRLKSVDETEKFRSNFKFDAVINTEGTKQQAFFDIEKVFSHLQ